MGAAAAEAPPRSRSVGYGSSSLKAMMDEPGSFYICTETSPRCYIIQKVCIRWKLVVLCLLASFFLLSVGSRRPSSFLLLLPLLFVALSLSLSLTLVLLCLSLLSARRFLAVVVVVLVRRRRPLIVEAPDARVPVTHAFVLSPPSSDCPPADGLLFFRGRVDRLTSTSDYCHTFASRASTVDCS